MPEVTVEIPPALRSFVAGAPALRVDARTVGEAVAGACERFPALRRHLLSQEGTFRPFVSVFLNAEDVRDRAREATPVAAGDRVTIVPAIAGGAPPRKGRRSPRPRAPRTRPLSPEEIQRYSRHLLLPEVGLAGQRRLGAARVLLVGTGGLGSPAALYLAAAGVGTLGIVDFDAVDPSNLQRQVLFGTPDVGRPKVEAARDRLLALNPSVRVERHPFQLDRTNALELIRSYDVVVDGTDNFPTRYLVNDACGLTGRPSVYGSIYRFEGQVSVFDARRGPCYRCLYPEPPPPSAVPTCAEAGVLGVLPGVVGTLQATETVKLLLGIGEPLVGRLLLYDALGLRFRELRFRKDPRCPLCSPHAPIRALVDYEAFCGAAAVPAADGVPEIGPAELADALAGAAPPLLVDVREPEERSISTLPGAIAIARTELAERIAELERAPAIVVYCRAGVRSAEAVRTLRALGFTNVRSLKGGINAWAREVDPRVPVY